MTRAEIEEYLEEKYLNQVVKYRAITDILFVGKVDRISFYDDIVTFIMNGEMFKCDLDWLRENFIIIR